MDGQYHDIHIYFKNVPIKDRIVHLRAMDHKMQVDLNFITELNRFNNAFQKQFGTSLIDKIVID